MSRLHLGMLPHRPVVPTRGRLAATPPRHKGVVLFSGLVADVEAAVRLATGALERPELLVRDVVIPQLHPGLWENVGETTWFGSQVMGKL